MCRSRQDMGSKGLDSKATGSKVMGARRITAPRQGMAAILPIRDTATVVNREVGITVVGIHSRGCSPSRVVMEPWEAPWEAQRWD